MNSAKTHQNPEVSVLLPVYNSESTLSEAIDSILSQTFEDFEFIAVDDGSSDNSADILNRYVKIDPRVKVISIPHQGIVPALNMGLQEVNGTFIVRMDADDHSHPERLQQQVQYLKNNNDIGLVSCLVDFLGDTKSQAGYYRYVKWINRQISQHDISLNQFVESPIAHPTVMFRKELISEYGTYRNGDFPEDYELWLRWLSKGVKMAKIPETLLSWRDLPDRLSRTDQRYRFEAFYKIKAIYLASWLKENNIHHPDVMIWGAGRTTRKRADILKNYGINITAWIDIDPNKIGYEVAGIPVIAKEDIPDRDSVFVLGYVGRHGARKDILKYLESKNFTPGKDVIFAA
jgi:glycosyltransferase involved in cell wall biosynthesis